jgi:hypothetical protein
MPEYNGISLPDLAILGIAAWRLAFMFINERGPFSMLVWLRERAGIEHEDGVPVVYPDHSLARLLQCIYCLSFWTAGLLFCIWLLGGWSRIVVDLLAISGVAVMVHSLTHREG